MSKLSEKLKAGLAFDEDAWTSMRIYPESAKEVARGEYERTAPLVELLIAAVEVLEGLSEGKYRYYEQWGEGAPTPDYFTVVDVVLSRLRKELGE